MVGFVHTSYPVFTFAQYFQESIAAEYNNHDIVYMVKLNFHLQSVSKCSYKAPLGVTAEIC